jgi:hypothetical protein
MVGGEKKDFFEEGYRIQELEQFFLLPVFSLTE